MPPEMSTPPKMGAPPAMRAPTEMGAPTMRATDQHGGHLYMQTNEVKNAIIHYHRSATGALAEVERVATGGAGSGLISPIYHIARPNHFEGAGSVRLTPDRRFLFATNGGDNSVSSFAVDDQGWITLVDVKRTGNTQNGGAKSLAYDPSSRTLFVVHTVGPDHLRLLSVDEEGNLTPRPEKYSVNTMDWNNRCPTMAALSPDGKFLFVGTTFDELPSRKNPDGSLILWIPKGNNGDPHFIASNAPDPDGIVVFPVGGNGALGEPSFYDGGGVSPFYIAFLHNRPDTFVVGYAVGDGVSIGRVDANGKIAVGPVVPIDTSGGVPSELCWLAVSPDDRFVFATDFGYGYLSSFRIDGNLLTIAKDPACPKIPGDGTFRALDGVVSSGPSDNWMTPDGDYLYQIFGNASKLVGYATKPDGSLEQVTSVTIPYNSPEGLAGF
ncbi:MAG TPA: beta-propeller fold lactonase family protein [Gemmatimonadaceae bacterium]|nr:beta-propeller fold lactonase family protein [Gemmatimonadaceae bacterium]